MLRSVAILPNDPEQVEARRELLRHLALDLLVRVCITQEVIDGQREAELQSERVALETDIERLEREIASKRTIIQGLGAREKEAQRVRKWMEGMHSKATGEASGSKTDTGRFLAGISGRVSSMFKKGDEDSAPSTESA